MKDFLEFNFKNCCLWKKLAPALRIIIKTITGLFPLTWQDGIGGDLVDYSLTGANSANVWDEEWRTGVYSTTTGEFEITSSNFASKNKIRVSPNTEYYFNYSYASYAWVFFYDENNDFISATPSNPFTTPANCSFINFHLAGDYGIIYNHDISINYPSTDHDYHPHGVGDFGGKRNQLVVNGNFESADGWGYSGGNISCENNVLSQTTDSSSHRRIYKDIGVVSGHKYYCSVSVKATSIFYGFYIYFFGTSEAGGSAGSIESVDTWTEFKLILQSNTTEVTQLSTYIPIYSIPSAGETINYKNFQVIDLTALFPTDTPTTVLEAKQRIAEVMGGQQEYYQYDAGSDYYKLPMVVTSGGCVDLGTLNWSELTIGGVTCFVDNLTCGGINKVFCKKYKATENTYVGNMNDKEIIALEEYSAVYIRDDSYTDATAFKSAMSGVYLYYQRATDSSWYIQNKTIYRTTQLTANQTIRKTTDGLPNFTSLPTGYLQMGVDTEVQPSAGSVTYKSRSVGV